MASMPTSRGTSRSSARQVDIGCERRRGRQRQPEAQARSATERRARQLWKEPGLRREQTLKGQNPMDGAKVEKTWQVAEAGVQRDQV
jgi:hypothetical protein